MISDVGRIAYPNTREIRIIGSRQSLDLMKLKNALTDRGFAAESLVNVELARTAESSDACCAFPGVVVVEGNAAGKALKRRLATIERTAVVNVAHRIVESQT